MNILGTLSSSRKRKRKKEVRKIGGKGGNLYRKYIERESKVEFFLWVGKK